MLVRILNWFKKHVWSATNIPALIALVLTVCFWQYSEYQSRSIHEQTVREEVTSHANLLRSQLEGNINSNLQLAKGLVSVLSGQPDMTPAEFERLAKNLFDGHSELTVIAGAPDLVISMIHPREGNEKAIGLDYNQNVAQRAAALRARDSGSLILAGPVNLVQGGQGFIGRFPVFTDNPDGTQRFWGIVSAVIDVQKLYENSGLTNKDLPIDVSLVGKDALGARGEVFFGPDKRDFNKSVRVNVSLPNGSWQMLACPKGGWKAHAADLTSLRIAMLFAGLLVFAPTAYSGHLMRQREKQNAELAMREERIGLISERLNVALSSSDIGVWEANLVTGDRFWDRRTNLLFGLDPQDTTRSGDAFINSLHPDDAERVLSAFNEAIEKKSQLSTQFRIITPQGITRHLQSRCAYYHPIDGYPKMVGVNWDITAEVNLRDDLLSAKRLAESKNVELEGMQIRIKHLALHDPLTMLPNRRFLDQTIEEYVPNDRNENMVAMLAIDLDRFKQINDSLGHLAGDATLRHVAKVLSKSLDEQDFVARVGGDEFVIILERELDKAELAALAHSIIEKLKVPFIYEGQPCRFGASVGIAYARSGEADLNDLMTKSDIALYRAKELGRNCYEFFSNDQQERIVKAREVSEDILWGLELSQFVPYYQPQFDAHTGAVIGVEALARWDHPDKGVLTPYDFLKVAEDINVIDEIDHEILTSVLNDMKSWEEQGVSIAQASVNISSPRLRDENLVRRLQELEIEPGKITFELLESIFLDDCDTVVERNLAKIKAMGIEIDIDDFGTGHASIVGLLNLQPSRIKIDRQFVASIGSSDDQRRLTKSMIDMGKSLNIEVLAEGVETEEQAEILRSLGVDALQGYLYAKPMSAADLRSFMKDHQRQAS
ncbi:EAL domain-containing protein [Maritalea porphyrae]|jgi:diguanylate cyclase (GGDEF)-like protein|nr:EAL domain-containing protein [Maritalea porphyrae]MCZ4271697.1 EAL domain-containing protein [Maritalea porphyrae]